MFKNYVRDRNNKTPVNLAVARVIFCAYLIWKVGSVHWERIYEWGQVPGYEHKNLQSEQPDAYSTDMVLHLEPLVPDIALANAHYLQMVAILFLLLLAAGYRIRITAYAASFFVSYLGIMHAFVDHSWSTQILLISGIILMLFALYAEEDVLSHDGFRQYRKHEFSSINSSFDKPLVDRPTYKSTSLTLLLLSLGVLYFGSGVGKVVQSGPEWIVPWNLGRLIHGDGGYIPELGEVVRQFDVLLVAGATGTLILESGFILAILTGKLFSAMIIGLITFHVGVALIQGPVFTYTIVLYLLFLDYENIMEKLQPKDKILVIYNPNCIVSSKILYIFGHLDVHGRMNFQTSDRNSNQDLINNQEAICVKYKNITETGIAAIQFLSKNTLILYPLVRLFTTFPASVISHKMYNYYCTPVQAETKLKKTNR